MRIYLREDEDFAGQAELFAANVERSLRGRKGQSSLRELEAALLALPEKRLIADDLTDPSGNVCALAALAKHQGAEIPELTPPENEYDDAAIHDQMISFGESLSVPKLVTMEIVYQNDGGWLGGNWTPEERYRRMLEWTQRQLRSTEVSA